MGSAWLYEIKEKPLVSPQISLCVFSNRNCLFSCQLTIYELSFIGSLIWTPGKP